MYRFNYISLSIYIYSIDTHIQYLNIYNIVFTSQLNKHHVSRCIKSQKSIGLEPCPEDAQMQVVPIVSGIRFGPL